MISIPYSIEINDIPAFLDLKQSAEMFGRMICDQFDVLYEDGAKTGRVMAISLHPFPHRASLPEQILRQGARSYHFAPGSLDYHRQRNRRLVPAELSEALGHNEHKQRDHQMAEFRVWLLHPHGPRHLASRLSQSSANYFSIPHRGPLVSENCWRDPLTVRAARPGEQERGGVREVSGVLACPKMSAWAWDIQGPACSAYRAGHLAEHQL